MSLPEALVRSLEQLPGFNREAFVQTHAAPETITSVRVNPIKVPATIAGLSLQQLTRVPWTQWGYYLPERPSFTFDPLFHAGTYYVQEASSMFLEQALVQATDTRAPLKVLDLCAAPGGKSTHLLSLIGPDSLLVANEVIRSRTGILTENICKWGYHNCVVTRNDPADFSVLENYFDVIVADAPCSGSGLFRREPAAQEEWSENSVLLCAQRQQRILADVLPALKKDGILVYSTCSFSREEDEDICRWLQETFLLEPLQLDIPAEWNIAGSGGAYRFWPDKLKGEGFFLACFRKKDGKETVLPKPRMKPVLLTAKERSVVQEWVDGEGLQFVKKDATVFAWPESLETDFGSLLEKLNVVYAGVRAGELVRDKFIPDHALAVSDVCRGSVPRCSLDTVQAIRYLQKKELEISHPAKGWQLVEFSGFPLGWINVLTGRINNYYPKGLRILKQD